MHKTKTIILFLIFVETLKNHKKLAYLEAAVALAFGYFKREKEVNVFYWANDKHKLGHLPWNHEYISIDEAFKLCDALEVSLSDG